MVRPKGEPPYVVHVVALVAMGVLFLLFGGAQWERVGNFARTSARARGTIVQIQQGPATDEGGPLHYPVVAFSTKSGERRQFRSQIASDVFFSVGDTVDVSYIETDPSSAEIDSFLTLWLAPMTFLIGGVGSLGLAVFVYWNTVRGYKDAPVRR